ncbi:MAG: RNA-binding domain-containing protein [Cupriavidus necator]
MIDIQSIADLDLLRESVGLECKLALGREGQGALPEDFWPTYSAFANTDGGVVVLGVREKPQQFLIEGLANVAKVRKELFDGLNNRQKVSANLLTDAAVREVMLDGRTLLLIEIPRATRKQRPVHLTTNPFAGHTYRRLNDGDRPLLDDEVRRMIAEQVEDSRDDRILRGYDFGDLCMETFRAYRQVFANREPGHPWNALEDLEFLRQLGGWRKDRETGESGLTLAGLLMFGWMTTIQEELPNYMLDYQERPEAKTELRWVDRLTLDGKWSGNLYDFYRKVYLKLTADLKVPFTLEKGERKDETPVHVALREALANVMVHADYSDRASVLVVKRPDMFGFRNPGLMRIPPEVAIRGGEHDCRNRTLHKMFRLVGVGEQAGSGIPKIYGGWATQHWRAPALYERNEPYNQTLMELRMVDLLPRDLLASLRKAFGARFDALEQNERLTLAAAASEKVVTHARVREMTGLHPFDATRLLQNLVREGLLEAHNPGRGAVYCLPGAALPKPEEVFGAGPEQPVVGSPNLGDSSPNLAPSSPNLTVSPPDLAGMRNADGCLLADQLSLPVIDDLGRLSPRLRASLEAMASEPRAKGKVDRDVLIGVIVALCEGRFVTLRCLAELVNRKPDTLREQYLSKLVRDRKLSLAFPTTPTHERQAYCATSSLPT